MASFAEYEEGYQRNWAKLKIRENRMQEARNRANHVFRGKEIYEWIETKDRPNNNCYGYGGRGLMV